MRRFIPVFLIILTVISVASPLIDRQALIPGPKSGEAVQILYPFQQFSISELAHGRMPFWNPYIFCGTPHLAHPQSAVFYPLNLISLWIGVERGLFITALLHLAIIGLGGYYYTRTFGIGRGGALVAGLVLCLSAPVSLKFASGHLSILGVMAYLPYIYANAVKYVRGGKAIHIWAAIWLLALAYLAGYPPLFFIALVLLPAQAAVFLFLESSRMEALDRAIKFIILSVAGCVFLTFFQMGPAIEFIERSVRWDGAAPDRFFFFPVENLLTLFVPDIWGNGLTAPYIGRFHIWETSGYIGIGALFLLAAGGRFVGKDGKANGLLAGFVIILMSIPNVCVHLVRLGWIGTSRGASELLFFPLLFVLPMIGKGFEKLCADPPAGQKMEPTGASRLWEWWIVLAGTVGIWAGIMHLTNGIPWSWILRLIPSTSLESRFPVETGEYAQNLSQFDGVAICAVRSLVLSAAAISLMAFRRHRRTTLFKFLWFVLVIGDLFLFSRRYLQGTDPSITALPKSVGTMIRSKADHHRVLIGEPCIQNSGMLNDLMTPTGNSFVVMANFASWADRTKSDPFKAPLYFSTNIFLINRTAVRTVVGQGAAWGLVASDTSIAGWNLFNNSVEGFPRQFMIKTLEDNLDRLRQVVWDSPSLRTAVWQTDEPAYKKLETNEPDPGFLVILDTFESNWEARIDGAATELTPLPIPFQSVQTPAGRHTIELRYHPRSFYFCLPFSIVMALLLIGWGIRIFWIRRS